MSICCKPFFLVYFMGFLVFQGIGYGQEIEDTAEVFLEEYSDEFQEYFFEALKQKGIENYDRAINMLLKCKKLQPTNTAVTNELAKAYLAEKKFILAQGQAEESVKAAPTNIWFLQTLMFALKSQRKNIDALKKIVPYSNPKLKENLAHLLYLERDYDTAYSVIKELEPSIFKSSIEAKIVDAIAQRTNKTQVVNAAVTSNNPSAKNNPVENYRVVLKDLILDKNYDLLENTAREALESYPSQPYFYYALGTAHNGKKRHTAAIKSLETALDYLLEDAILQENIYIALITAYTALGNLTKANMYLLKINAKN